jgi:hypothetical protein
VLHTNGKSWSNLEVSASLPANMGFTDLTGDGAGGFWALDVAIGAASGVVPAEDLVHYSGKWTVEALPAIPGSVSGTTSVVGLFPMPGIGQVWAPATYDVAPGGQPSALIFRFTP